MEPTFRDGQLVWVYTWAYRFGKPKVRDVVIVQFADGQLLKRVSKVGTDGVVVSGDNQNDSLDSRKFGEIKYSQIIGKVLPKV